MVNTMNSTTLEYFYAVPIAVVVGIAIVTDLRSRRIPNTLTFPAIAIALLVRFALQGFLGLGLAAAGAVVAPVVLLAVHFGKGIGMGDLKLAAAVGAKLGESFDEMLTPARLEFRDPVERLSFGFAQFLERAISDADWARLVVQSSQSPNEFGLGVRANLKADISEAIAKDRLGVRDVELAADIVIGIWIQVTRGILERGARPELINQANEAVLRAIGAMEARAA